MCIEVYTYELDAIKYRDIKNLSYNNCAKKMNISKDEFKKILISARRKSALSIIENSSLKIIEHEKIEPQEIITSLCTFRCATCGLIYSVNYLENIIVCPNCESSKIMSLREAGLS